MKLTLKVGTAALALAAAFSFMTSSTSFAQQAANTMSQDQSLDAAQAQLNGTALDDMYADLSQTEAFGPGGPRGPGGPPPGGGWGPGGPGGPGGPPPGGGWGPPPGGGGGWGRGVQCRAVNRRGMAFYGQGRNMPEARDQALWNCQRVSLQCWMDGCNPL